MHKDGYAKDDATINRHFYTFLTGFLQLHDRYLSVDETGRKKSRNIYFTGESHAGHYIPTIIKYILEKNKEITSQQGHDGILINVAGAALGNPWIYPAIQYNPADFAHGMGIITKFQSNKLNERELVCQSQLNQKKLNNRACFALLDDIIDSSSLNNAQKVLMYDARKFVHNARAFPPGHTVVETYLNKQDVRKAIHATSATGRYVECADPPYYALAHQDGLDVLSELTFLLNNNINLLIYSGQYDLICDHINTEKVLDIFMTSWMGYKDWVKAQPGVWVYGKKPVGYVRRYNNLQSLLVLEAGHMVPMDQPEIAMQMMKEFMSGSQSGSKASGLMNGASKIDISLSSPRTGALSGINCETVNNSGLKGSGRRLEAINPVNVSHVHAHTTMKPLRAHNHSHHASSSHLNRSSHVPHSITAKPHIFYPVITRISPSPTNTSLSIIVHTAHSSSTNSGQHTLSHHATHSAISVWQDIISRGFYLHVMPGNISLTPSRSWFDSIDSRDKSAGHIIEIQLEGLHSGRDYHIGMKQHEFIAENASKSLQKVHLPLSARRVYTARTGCYQEKFVQCCHHGECVALVDGGGLDHGSSQCRCDIGYAGVHCSQLVGSGEGKASDLMSCPTQPPRPPAVQIHFDLSRYFLNLNSSSDLAAVHEQPSFTTRVAVNNSVLNTTTFFIPLQHYISSDKLQAFDAFTGRIGLFNTRLLLLCLFLILCPFCCMLPVMRLFLMLANQVQHVIDFFLRRRAPPAQDHYNGRRGHGHGFHSNSP